jgi:GDP-L-fucose synthase
MGIGVDDKIYVVGHDSLIGAVLCRKLQALGYWNVLTRSHDELDLRNQLAVQCFFEQELPDYVFLATITGEQVADNLLRPAETLYARLMTLSNVIHAAYLYDVRKLLSVIDFHFGFEVLRYELDDGSVNRHREDSVESNNLMKLVVSSLCDRYREQYNCDFISVMFHLDPVSGDADDLGATLTPTAILDRQDNVNHQSLLYAPDPADACLFLMKNFSATGPIAVRTGRRGPGVA